MVVISSNTSPLPPPSVLSMSTEKDISTTMKEEEEEEEQGNIEESGLSTPSRRLSDGSTTGSSNSSGSTTTTTNNKNNNSSSERFDDNSKSSTEDPSMYLKDELYQLMRDQSNMFDWIQMALGDGIWYLNLENPIDEWMSPEFKKLFGYEDCEVPNTSEWWQQHIFPEDLPSVYTMFDAHIKHGKPYDQIVRYKHKNGSTVWVRCHGKALFDDNGKPIRMLGAHNDLTEFMVVQEQLKKKEAVLDLLCTTSLDGYWDWDMESGNHFMSIRWKNLLGYDDHELSNRIETWWSLLLTDDHIKLQNAIQRHKEDKEPFNVVLRYFRKDGSIAYMLAQGIAQKDEITGKWIRMFGTHTDVSYLEEAKAAREASAAKTTFLATMSHEIRTPLNAILGMAQILMTTELTEEQQDCVSTLHNSGSHLLSLINDILDFSQIESGIIRLQNEEVDIQKTVRDVLDVLQHSADKKKLPLGFHYKLRTGTKLRGDSERIRQIMFNLLGNAIKFTSKGSVCIDVAPAYQDGVSGVEIAVRDTGCGMTEEQVVCIFDVFQQASHEIRSKYGGSGLGLSISKRLIKAMGGTIKVESILGVGTTFTVFLPGIEEPEIPIDECTTLNHDPIYLYEDIPDDLSSLYGTILASGITINKIREASELAKSEGNGMVFVHHKTPDPSDHCKLFIANLLEEKSNIKIIDVGKKVINFIPEQYKHRYDSLPRFPTTDEIKQIVKERQIPEKPTFHRSKMIEVAPIHNDRQLKILVAEDNLINQKVIVRLLSRLNCDVIIANNGVEAVEMAKEGGWDLIFMDLIMPEMDGLDATRAIRSFDKDTPIVALTANATTDDRELCFNTGMDGFLTKPVNLDSLRKVLSNLTLSGKQQE